MSTKPMVDDFTPISSPAQPSRERIPDYQRYEQLKRQPPSDLTAEEYTRRVLLIAEECGI